VSNLPELKDKYHLNIFYCTLQPFIDTFCVGGEALGVGDSHNVVSIFVQIIFAVSNQA
jgi:hypothetical protein